jgi:DNA polymerase-4
MAKYAEVGRQVRALMLAATPSVEPLSIDEAFLDLSGTGRLHGMSPAKTLARLVRDIESAIGITASVGLAPNKYLAKVASDLQKPRGFSVIGTAEAPAFLAGKPVSLIWGVGRAMQEKLARQGITHIGQLQTMEKGDLMRRFGSMGSRLYHLSRGEDMRTVSPDEDAKSVSAETTFDTDISSFDELEAILWTLCERVSRRAKKENCAGRTVTLKLKTSDFKIRTRAASLEDPTQMAHRIFDASRPLLQKEATGVRFRLIGVGISHLNEPVENEEQTLDSREAARSKAERAMDVLQGKFGKTAVERGITRRRKDH